MRPGASGNHCGERLLVCGVRCGGFGRWANTRSAQAMGGLSTAFPNMLIFQAGTYAGNAESPTLQQFRRRTGRVIMVDVARMTRGSVTIPARLRKEVGFEDGTIVGFEVRDGGVVIMRVRIVPVEDDTSEGASTQTPTDERHQRPREAVESAEA
jgi:bifunctional DNA-binding transcriptional regulator/antitoxin component of YhaV-PrlF toxin-antitoxin module